MVDETAQVHARCPNSACNHVIAIEQIWAADGANDYGGYILECRSCHTVFDLYLGQDIYASRVLDGAKVLDTYDDAVGNKTRIFARYGLNEANDS
jgi:hypothetical protein